MDKYESLWQKILYELESIFNDEVYSEVFEPLKSIQCVRNGLVYIVVPNNFIKGRIERLYASRINALSQQYSPSESIRFKFITENEIPEDDSLQKKEKDIDNKYRVGDLNASFSFENFIVGDSNFYAFKTSNMVANQLGVIANPLYIFGDVGLGKTHLMQAIGNYVLDKDPQMNVLYVKANAFIDDYVHLVDKKRMDLFYEKYSDIDVFLIDDIQILGGKTKTQQELFKIYDELIKNNKQIVITSDQVPASLKEFSSRLTSRFQQGLQVQLKAPDFEHRIRILKDKISSSYPSDILIPEDVLEYIAEHFPTNIRELHGALNNIIYYSLLINSKLTLELAKEHLEPLVTTRKITNTLNENNYDKVQSIVAEYFKITVADLIGPKRGVIYTTPRHIAMYLIKTLYDIPYKTIGNLFGKRDHSTVLSAVEKIDHEIKVNDGLKEIIETISKKINHTRK